MTYDVCKQLFMSGSKRKNPQQASHLFLIHLGSPNVNSIGVCRLYGYIITSRNYNDNDFLVSTLHFIHLSFVRYNLPKSE